MKNPKKQLGEILELLDDAFAGVQHLAADSIATKEFGGGGRYLFPLLSKLREARSLATKAISDYSSGKSRQA